MREALFCFKVANEFAASAFAEFAAGEFDVGGFEVGGDVCGGGFFADYEDLGARHWEGQRQECRCCKGRSVCKCHESTSDIEQLALSLCF
jgi:hypothetical protein